MILVSSQYTYTTFAYLKNNFITKFHDVSIIKIYIYFRIVVMEQNSSNGRQKYINNQYLSFVKQFRIKVINYIDKN